MPRFFAKSSGITTPSRHARVSMAWSIGLVVVHFLDDVEIARAAKLADQIAALRRLIQIVDDRSGCGRRPGSAPIRRSAASPAAAAARRSDCADRGECAASPCGPWRGCGGKFMRRPSLLFSIRLTNTSSIDGTMESSAMHRNARALQNADRFPESPAPASSTLTCRPPPNTATSRIPCCPSSAVMLPSRSDDSRFSKWPVAQRSLQLRGRAQRDHLARHTSARRGGSTRPRPCSAW